MTKKYIVFFALFGYAWSCTASSGSCSYLCKQVIVRAYEKRLAQEAEKKESIDAHLLQLGITYTVIAKTKQIEVLMPCLHCPKTTLWHLSLTDKPHQAVFELINDEISLCNNCNKENPKNTPDKN